MWGKFLRPLDKWAASRSWVPLPSPSLALPQLSQNRILYPLELRKFLPMFCCLKYQLSFSLFIQLLRIKNCDTLSQAYLQVSPQTSPQWTLYGDIVKPSVISGSNQSGFGSDPSLPSLSTPHKRPTFSVWPLLRFLALMLQAFAFPLFQGWAGDTFFKSYFNARGNKDGTSAKNNILCWAFLLCPIFQILFFI